MRKFNFVSENPPTLSLFARTLTIIHDCRGDILACYALIPSRLNIQIESRLAAVLSRVAEVPLKWKVGIGRNISRILDDLLRFRIIADGCGFFECSKAPFDAFEA